MSSKYPSKSDVDKVFKVFEKNYILVPLEIFKEDPYKILISTLLSSKTKDEVTLAASKRLFKKASDIYKLKMLKTIEIEKLIYPVGFYKTKSKHLNKLSEKVISEFNGNIPKTREDLIALPGVGRKTANLVLNRAYKTPAIAVDTHVHRISNLLGWVDTKTPEQTEKELNRILPREYWSDINRLFVSIGRKYRTNKQMSHFLQSNDLI